MKIKRFFAPDIRQAMRMVKEELGADAVIMSNRSVDGGVEIVAARDFDEQLIQSKLQKQAAAEEQPQRETKKLDLPDFEAEKNRLHVLSSQRKQSAEGFVPERPSVRPNRFSSDSDTSAVHSSRSNRFPTDSDTSAIPGSRSNRFPTDPDTSAVPGSRRNIDQYVGYAEKVHLRGTQETAGAKAASGSARFNTSPAAPVQRPMQQPQRPMQAERPMQIVKPAEKQSNLADKLLLEMSKELKSLRSALDSKLSGARWGGVSQFTPVRAD